MNLVNILKSIDFTFFYRKKQINYDNLAESQLGQAITFIIIITKVKKQIN